jgi:hypothetical protein
VSLDVLSPVRDKRSEVGLGVSGKRIDLRSLRPDTVGISPPRAEQRASWVTPSHPSPTVLGLRYF